MDVVFALVGVSVVLVIVIAAVLLWAIRSGQFEDMEGPAWRVVLDDDRPGERNRAKNDVNTGPDEAAKADEGAGKIGQPDATAVDDDDDEMKRRNPGEHG